MSTEIVQVIFQGRFGNNLFQYAYGRALAEKLGAKLEVQPWIGPRVFEGINPSPLTTLPDKTYCDYDEIPVGEERVIRLRGFWQATKFVQLFGREKAREWFQIRDTLKPMYNLSNYIACHLRRGDLTQMPDSWCVVSTQSYQWAIEKYCGDMPADTKIIWLGDHEPTVEINMDIPEDLDFMRDFQVLMHAHTLFRGNSSFSWWAAALGNPRVFSPRVNGKTGFRNIEFEPGNHCPFTSDEKAPDIVL